MEINPNVIKDFTPFKNIIEFERTLNTDHDYIKNDLKYFLDQENVKYFRNNSDNIIETLISSLVSPEK